MFPTRFSKRPAIPCRFIYLGSWGYPAGGQYLARFWPVFACIPNFAYRYGKDARSTISNPNRCFAIFLFVVSWWCRGSPQYLARFWPVFACIPNFASEHRITSHSPNFDSLGSVYYPTVIFTAGRGVSTPPPVSSQALASICQYSKNVRRCHDARRNKKNMKLLCVFVLNITWQVLALCKRTTRYLGRFPPSMLERQLCFWLGFLSPLHSCGESTITTEDLELGLFRTLRFDADSCRCSNTEDL